jgi:hypothetical protein
VDDHQDTRDDDGSTGRAKPCIVVRERELGADHPDARPGGG